MRATRKSVEEQYQMVLACRRSGMTGRDWCRKNGINLRTYYNWIRRLKRDGRFRIPPARRAQVRSNAAYDIVPVEILQELPEGCSHGEGKENPISAPMQKSTVASIEIEAMGAIFRFTGSVDPSLYEKTLLMIGGRL